MSMRILRFALLLLLALPVQANAGQDQTDKANEPQTTAQTPASAAGKLVVLRAPAAEYPESARQRKLFGHCTVSMKVDLKGVPRNVKVESCSNPLFIQSSYAAAKLYRFKPATDSSGKSVETRISVQIHYGIFDGQRPTSRVRYALFTPPGVTSPEADPQGVFPLTRKLIPPKIVTLKESSLGEAALAVPDGSACDVVLTITSKGEPTAPWVSRCDDSILEKPMLATVMETKYKAGQLNGCDVAVRMLIRLTYMGVADPHQE